MTLLLLILGMGVITYLIRLLPIALEDRLPLTGRIRQPLRFVPVAVLTAIIATELLFPTGELALTLDNARPPAGLLAALVAWRSGNIVLTLAAGMGTFWLVQAVGVFLT